MFHLTGWRKIVEDTFGHAPHYLVAERGNEWLGVLPMFRIRSPIVGNNLIAVPYGVYGGVLSFEREVTTALLEAARDIGVREKVDYIELRERCEILDGLPESGLYVTYRKTLPEVADEVMPALPKRARAEVRKARDRFKLKCEVSDDLSSFYKLFVANKKRLGSPSLPFRWFKALRDEFGSQVVVHIVREPSGTPIAAVMSFCFDDAVYAYYSGSLHTKNCTGVNNFIYCKIMEWAAERGFKMFDFGRSRKDSGPAAFKKNMGFVAEPLHYQYYLLTDTARLPAFNPSNPRLAIPRRIWSHLPPFLARGLSRPLSRYLP